MCIHEVMNGYEKCEPSSEYIGFQLIKADQHPPTLVRNHTVCDSKNSPVDSKSLLWPQLLSALIKILKVLLHVVGQAC